jgi:uncharacterized protein (TIGR03437 family)
LRAFILLLAATPFLLSQGIWESRAPYPVPITEVSGAAIGDEIYTLCGIGENNQWPRNVYVYDTVRDTWSQRGLYPIAGGADHCNVAAVDDRLYLLGAIRIGTGFVDGNTYMYNPRTDQWQTVGRMNVPRGASGVAVIGRRIYVAGGLRGGGTVSDDFEVFDTETRTWTTLPPMPTARDHLTAQAAGGRFYALAGRRGAIAAGVAATEEYDPATGVWRQRAPIPVPRGGIGSGVIRGRIVVFGGEGSAPNHLGTFDDVHEYDPATDVWRPLTPMPTARHGLYGIVVEERIFAPGGGPLAGAHFSSAHEVYYPPPVLVPRVEAAGVRNAANFTQALAPGSLFSVFGEHLSYGRRVADFLVPWPDRLNAVEIRVNGLKVPLLFAGPGQINGQLPFNLALTAPTVQPSNANTAGQSVRLAPLLESAPGIFTLSMDGRGQGAVLVANTGIVAAPTNTVPGARPVRRGEFIEIYCTGLGQVQNPPEAGTAAPMSPLSRTVLPARVTIGGVDASVSFSGLAPGFVGLYQVNAQVAANTPAGPAVPLVIRMGDGIPSNEVTIAVGN